jgi:hypothetical protein
MESESLTLFIKSLQGCITPVAMFSAVGLFILTVTNRMARTIDRTRQLINELDKEGCLRYEEKYQEVKIFIGRSRLLRNSIAFIVAGMICTCLMIPTIFIMNFTNIDLSMLGYSLFLIAVISMLVAFIYFFRDVLISLKAIKLEAKDYL